MPEFPHLSGLRGFAIVGAVSASFGFGAGFALRDFAARSHERAQALAISHAALAAEQAARLTEQRAAEASAALGLKAAREQADVRHHYSDLIRSIPAHVTPEADRNCTVPAGFVRVYDDAARGLSRPADTARQPDDAASGIALSAVAAGAAENFGLCHEIRGQLMALQQWEREVGQ